MNLESATVKKHGKKLMGSNRQGSLLIEHSVGTRVTKIQITHLNDEHLYALSTGDKVDITMVITPRNERAAISQPHLARR